MESTSDEILQNLSMEGEEAFACGVHENEFALVASVGAIGVGTEEELAVGGVGGESITGEEDRSFEDGKMDLLFVYEFLICGSSVVHFFMENF